MQILAAESSYWPASRKTEPITIQESEIRYLDESQNQLKADAIAEFQIPGTT